MYVNKYILLASRVHTRVLIGWNDSTHPFPPGATPGDRENLPSRLKKEASSSSERRRGREVGWILLINVELELPDAPQEEAEGESEKARN